MIATATIQNPVKVYSDTWYIIKYHHTQIHISKYFHRYTYIVNQVPSQVPHSL